MIGLVSCKDRSKSKSKNFLIPAQDHPFVSLGQGYNPSTGAFAPKTCYSSTAPNLVKLDVEDADLKLIRGATLDNILNRLSGSLSMSYPIYPGVEAGANIRLAISNATTNTSETFSSLSKVNYSQSLPPQLELNDNGKSVLALADQQGLTGASRNAFFNLRCGEEIIDKIYYGATLNILIDFDYGSSISKQRFGAGLSLELLGGIAKVNVDANILNDNYAESVSVTINVKQVGGDPETITRLFPDGLPRCDYTVNVGWSKECLDSVRIIFAYAYGVPAPELEDIPSFIDQIRGLGMALVPLGYETHPRMENDPLKLWHGLGLDGSQSVIYQARELAIRSVLSRLELVGGVEKSFNAMLRSNGTYQNMNAYALYYQKILQQLEIVSSLKQELLKHIDECWKMTTPCTLATSNAKVVEIESRHPYDMDLSRYNKLVISIADWCNELGPESDSGFPLSRIFEPEKLTLQTLFKLTGIKPAPYLPSNKDEQARLLAERCGALETNLGMRSNLDLSKLGTSGFSISSMRVLDFLPGLEQLNVSDQIINALPRFYGLPRLKNLIMKNTRAYHGMLAVAKELPPSIRCLDMSAPDVLADFTKHIRPEVETLILRGWTLSGLTVQAGLKKLVTSTLSITPAALNEVAATLDHDMEIRLTSDPSFDDIPLGAYGRIKVVKDDGTLSCQSI